MTKYASVKFYDKHDKFFLYFAQRGNVWVYVILSKQNEWTLRTD
jgi:hypothetical protein